MTDSATLRLPRQFARGEAVECAAQVSHDVIGPHAARVDANAEWPGNGIRALLDVGLGGLAVSTQHGGSGLGLPAIAQVCESIGRQCASTALCFGMHVVASAVINAEATADQIERFLVPICAGRHLTTLALSEPGTGTQFYLPQTTMRTEGGDMVLEGTKSFVTNGGHADSYVVSTVAGDPGAMADTYLGVAETALEEVREHLRRRENDRTGHTLSHHQFIQHRVGTLWGTVAAYRENSKLARLLRDARAAHVMSPTTDLLRIWTGRAYLGLPLLSE